MKDYIHLLKEIGDGIERKVFEKNFENENERIAFEAGATAQRHVVPYQGPRGKMMLKLSPEGKSFLNEKSQKWYRKPEWWGIIVSGLIGFAGVIIGYIALLKP